MNKKKNIKNAKLLIFDWNGTISDDRIPVQTAFNRVATELGLKPIEDLKEWLKQSVKAFEEEYSKQLSGAKSSEEIRQLYFKHFSTLREEGIKPTIYEDAVQTLTTIKRGNKKLIVISSHSEKSLLTEAEEYGLTKHFDRIIGSIKIKTDAIMQVCKDYSVDTRDSAYIGDMINDIKFAKQAKAISIALTQGYHDKKTLIAQKPDFIFDKLSDIVKHL